MSEVIQNLQTQVESLRNEVAEKEAQIESLRSELDIARNDIRNYVTSTSWRMTSPIRVSRNIVKRLFSPHQ